MSTPEPLFVLFLSNKALIKHCSFIRFCMETKRILILNLGPSFTPTKVTNSA